MPLYLGLDCSTQSLSAVLLRAGSGGRAEVVLEHALEFDRDLPRWGTRHGVLPSEDARVQVSPPGMWVEAIDAVLGALKASGLDLGDLAAVAGSAQQHGSVYLNAQAAAAFESLDPGRPPVDQLNGIYARSVAPIWMDTSTTAECDEIQAAMGGPAALARLTGSRAFERFAGPQIRKWWKTDPDAYVATARVHLVSSFLAAVLVGGDAPLEPGDASGMNLMDISTRDWSDAALAATAPDLRGKLPAIVPSPRVIGILAPYWQRRHGLPPARLVTWTGDNPSSLVGTGIVEEGVVAISLGTSDTVFGLMRQPRVDESGAGHVFGSPTGDWMGLTCFRNSSLARERVRDHYGLDWKEFEAALDATPPGNGGAVMLPWFEPEITPAAPAGVHRRHLDPGNAAANVRAVVEGQMLAAARHSGWMGVDVHTIRATGGASANDAILQVMADVFQARVERFEWGNSACLGAALRAWQAETAAKGAPLAWTSVVAGAPFGDARRYLPRAGHRQTYRELSERHRLLEAHVLGSVA